MRHSSKYKSSAAWISVRCIRYMWSIMCSPHATAWAYAGMTCTAAYMKMNGRREVKARKHVIGWCIYSVIFGRAIRSADAVCLKG